MDKRLKHFFRSDNLLPDFLIAVSFVVVAVPLWIFLHFWSLLIFAVLAANVLILIAHYKKISIPILSAFIAKEYGRIKTGIFFNKNTHQAGYNLEVNNLKLLRHLALLLKHSLTINYFKFLHHLALLFRSLEDNHKLLIDYDWPLGTEFSKEYLPDDREREEYLRKITILFQAQKRRAFHVSAFGSLALIAAAFVLSVVFAPQSYASTFGFIQSGWSGGASTAAVARHPGDKTNWDKYYSKDALVEASSSVVVNIVSTQTVYTSTADFFANTSVNALAATNSITMLKPTGAACSKSAECVGGSCSSGFCFSCGVDTVAYDGGRYDSNGISTTTGGYYRTVLIGDQCWLKEDINAGAMIGSKLADNTTPQDQTDDSVIEKYCLDYVQQGNAGQIAAGLANCNTYGGLYQFPEVFQYANSITLTDGTGVLEGNVRGICPVGWHIPSFDEFNYVLIPNLGDASVAGGKAKETGLAHWDDPNTDADNSSGFTALGAGVRYDDGVFSYQKARFYFWIAWIHPAYTWFAYINNNSATFPYSYTSRASGLSVRCLKD